MSASPTPSAEERERLKTMLKRLLADVDDSMEFLGTAFNPKDRAASKVEANLNRCVDAILARDKQQAKQLLSKVREARPKDWVDDGIHLDNTMRAFTAREHQLDDIELVNVVNKEWHTALDKLEKEYT